MQHGHAWLGLGFESSPSAGFDFVPLLLLLLSSWSRHRLVRIAAVAIVIIIVVIVTFMIVMIVAAVMIVLRKPGEGKADDLVGLQNGRFGAGRPSYSALLLKESSWSAKAPGCFWRRGI